MQPPYGTSTPPKQTCSTTSARPSTPASVHSKSKLSPSPEENCRSQPKRPEESWHCYHPLPLTQATCQSQQALPGTEAHNAFGVIAEPNFLYPKMHVKIDNQSLIVTFFFFTCLFERPARLQVISSGRYTGYQRQTKGRNAANLVQHPSTRQRHWDKGFLPHKDRVPERYLHTFQSSNEGWPQSRTSQADESCIGHGNKQEPRPEYSHTRALWPIRSYRPKFALPYRAFLHLSLGIAFFRLLAYTSFLALSQLDLSPVPREHTMRVLRMVRAGTHKRVRWVKAMREVGACL